MEILLEGVDLTFNDYTVFNDLNLKWNTEEDHYVMLLGPSGVGKSTLLHILGGEHLFYKGKLSFDGVAQKHPNDMHVPGYQNCALVGQKSILRMDYSLIENMEYRLKKYTGEYKNYRSNYLIKAAGLEEVKDHKVKLLSGGELQRAGIIFALADMPDLLLLDEPFNQLNAAHKLTMQTLIEDEVKDAGSAVLHVTHNVEEIYSHNGAIFILSENGMLNFYKSFQQLYKRPLSPEDVRVFTFLNEINEDKKVLRFYPEKAEAIADTKGEWELLNCKLIKDIWWSRLKREDETIWVNQRLKKGKYHLEINEEILFTEH